jgi:hypothetical protein
MSTVLAPPPPSPAPKTHEVVVPIEGMTCAGCVR